MRILIWHVHGAWATAFVNGRHEYFIPVDDERGPDGRGRMQTVTWPEQAREVTRDQAQDLDVDLVVLQRPHELEHLCADWLGGRVPGRDVPCVYVEHNSPQGRINELHHPAADRPDLTLVHVTHFNRLFWDAGETPTEVIEHGIVDPGERYTGELPRAAVVVNEAGRRARVTGTDLLQPLNGRVPIDLFGMKAAELGGIEDLPQDELHTEVARRRVYLHPIRWTSLGLALLEAMHLGMPVVALATTEVPRAVPAAAGVVSNDLEELRAGLRHFVDDPDAARAAGQAARAHVLEHYSLARFHRDWDALLERVA